jgi:hypothetical protein
MPGLLQLVQSGRHRARSRRSLLDPADDRADGRRSRHRPASHLRHRAFRRRRDDLGDARDLSRSVRGGAVIAGLPFGVATNVREALNGMLQSPSRPAANWEIWCATRRSIKARGRNSRCGTAAPIAPSIPPTPMRSSSNGSTCIICRWRRCRRDVDGYPRQVWWNADGETIVESYTITDMAHGTPLGIADNDERYGAEGAFLIEAGISSSYHIANFFGLTERISRPAPARSSKPVVAKAIAAKPIAPSLRSKADPRCLLRHLRETPDVATVLRPLATLHRLPRRRVSRAAGRSTSAPSSPAR